MIAERIRLAIADQPIILPSEQRINMTASLGVATYPDHADAKESLIKQADQALYEAKHSGRNRVQSARKDKVISKSIKLDHNEIQQGA